MGTSGNDENGGVMKKRRVKCLLGSFFLVIADRCPQLLITFSDKSGMLLRQMLHINTSWTDAQCRVKLSSHCWTLGIPCFSSNFL
jgi:hypothetical protein